MAKKAIVTGASGHIGYHVANCLIGSGFDVFLLVRKTNRNTEDLENKGAQLFHGDLMEPESYEKILSDADVLFHLASENTTSTHDEKSVIRNTFELTQQVLDTAVRQKVPVIVYTSSVVVLGRSANAEILRDENSMADFLESPYVKGKFLAERYCDELIKNPSVDIRRLYPSWVIGSHDCKLTPPHRLVRNYVNKGQPYYFKGGISVASVEEVAKAHVNAYTIGRKNEKYVVAGDNISFRQFYSFLSTHSGHRAPSILLPKWFVYAASVVLKALLGKKNPVDPGYVKSVIGNFSWYDSGKAVRELNYAVPDAGLLLKEAVNDQKKKIYSLDKLILKNNPSLKRTRYEEDDVLLITGFPGWLGNRMVDVFMNGDRFGNHAIDRKIKLLVQPKFKGLVDLPSCFEIIYGDVTDKDSLKEALKKVKTVYHLAGVIYPKNIRSFYEINFEGTKNLADACIESGTRRILFMGTDSICGYGKTKKIFDENTPADPYRNYGKSKYMAEKYLLDKTSEGKIEATSLRGFWFFGPFMPARNLDFLKMFRWKKQLVFGNGKNIRSTSHVDNTIQAFLKSEKKQNTIGKWYWIADKKADCTVDEIYSHIAKGLGTTYHPLYVPKIICSLLSLFDRAIAMFGKINASVHAAGKFHLDIAGDCAAAIRDFEYSPDVGFDEIEKEIRTLSDENEIAV